MAVLEILASSGMGSLLGMRHALEPDHLAAVSTLVGREPNGYRAALLGACWGLGHTAALLVVGVVLVILRAEMPLQLTNAFEIGVAIMLIVLGARAITQAARVGPMGPSLLHRHRWTIHRHSGMSAHVHIGSWTFARRPLIVGAIHGLAGSGALTALVLATLPSVAARLTYAALFGLGSTLGMATVSGLLGWPLAHFGANEKVARAVSLTAGCLSTALGVAWGFRILNSEF